ncbi:MAG: hypothetical protein A2Z20_01070 [Bdellovibrionales bacterium RBG_16_40_8]|nr:MAG: hypothetical protein A2Z20_01070 [Bdellovibrionales bacterium RBG_16_40_8]
MFYASNFFYYLNIFYNNSDCSTWNTMITHILTISLAVFFIASSGCRFKNSSPHLLDPIYLDLEKELRATEQQIGEVKKKIESAKDDFGKSQPRTIERVNSMNDLGKAEKMLIRLQEMQEFYNIRLKRREVEDKINYEKAFADNADWPDKKEFEAYLVNKKLMNASRNWNLRVPKKEVKDTPNKD